MRWCRWPRGEQRAGFAPASGGLGNAAPTPARGESSPRPPSPSPRPLTPPRTGGAGLAAPGSEAMAPDKRTAGAEQRASDLIAGDGVSVGAGTPAADLLTAQRRSAAPCGGGLWGAGALCLRGLRTGCRRLRSRGCRGRHQRSAPTP